MILFLPTTKEEMANAHSFMSSIHSTREYRSNFRRGLLLLFVVRELLAYKTTDNRLTQAIDLPSDLYGPATPVTSSTEGIEKQTKNVNDPQGLMVIPV